MSTKTKILMDITPLFSDGICLKTGENGLRSGIFNVAYNLFNEFSKRNDIDLFLYASTTYYYFVKKALKKISPDLSKKLITEAKICAIYNFFKFNYSYTKTFSYKILQYIMFIPALLSKLGIILFPKKYNADLFFSPYHYPSYSIKKNKKLKKYIFLHDCIHILNIYKAGLIGSHFKNKVFNKLEKGNFYFTNSEYTRQDFIKHNPNVTLENSKTVLLAASNNFKPVKHNFDAVRKKYGIPEDKKYIFSLCTLEPRKNLIRTVKTFVEFIKKNNIDDLVFVMGGGQWEKFINELSNALNELEDYKSKILKIGYVDDDDLPALYSNAEWFVYTSMYEGFGLPPLEAMSCGCPVITSNATSLPEVVGDAGLLINYDSDEEHIKAYETYYFNPELRSQYAQKGFERSKLFSYKKTADEILSTMLNSF